MKKLLLFSFCLFSSLSHSQTTIVEEKLAKEDYFFDSHLLSHSNVMVIGIGKKQNVDAGINKIYSLDNQGNKTILFNDLNVFGFIFSNSEKTLLTYDTSAGGFFTKPKFLIDGKIIELNRSDKDNLNFNMYCITANFNHPEVRQSFTSKYLFNLTNQRDKNDFNFKKDEINLKVTDILTKKAEVYKIEKPNLDRLVGPDFIKPTEKVGLKLVVNYDETIDLVTKSISKDYDKTILYKTRYSNQGKKLNEVSFELNLTNRKFLYSLNDGGNMEDHVNNANNYHFTFEDDLSINNFYEDITNGDIYIYGLYGDEIEKLNSNNAKIRGYYVFKFDKNGNKIWESINKIEDEIINKGHLMTEVSVSLEELKNKMCFHLELKRSKTVGSDESIVKITYGILDKSSGSVLNSKTMFFEKKEFLNKRYDVQSIIAFQSDPKFSDYIKKIKSKKKLYLFTYFSEKGTWLLETDRKEYYKVTLFND